VKTMCRVLEVSRSGYYAWLKRAPSERTKANAALLETIRAIHVESDGTYGAPRIHADLPSKGARASLNRVARVMRGAGIRGVSRRKWTKTTRRDRDARPAPDLLERDFTATGPDQVWVADITYIPTSSGFLYLAIVLDVWSRRIVGWAMETHLRAELVLKALDMAVWQRRPTGVIHHSDQGTQYTSVAFGRRCKALGVRPSMGSVGDAYDNAMAESFFATLECELIDRYRFRTRSEATMAVFGFIEGWYNPRRRHSALGYESPMSFERKHGLGALNTSERTLAPLSAPITAALAKTRREDAPGSTTAASPYPQVPPSSGVSAPGRSNAVSGTAALYSPAP